MRRFYHEKDKALALAVFDATGGKLQAAADQAGVPRNTLRRWVADREKAAPSDLRQETANDLGERFNQIALLATGLELAILKQLTEKGVEDLGLEDLMKLLKVLAPGAGIATDKAQLLSGKPTDRHELHAKLDPTEALGVLRGAYHHDGASTS